MKKDTRKITALQNLQVHDSWAGAYRTAENQPFYEIAFDYLRTVYGPPTEDPVLDAGCGSSTKSIHLAKRGYKVLAVDFSKSILEVAKQEVESIGFDVRINHQWADLTDLPFKDETFQSVLCWGVLMHVPDIEKAIRELARVTRSGGIIVVSENNAHSLQAVILNTLKRLLKRNRAETRNIAAGVEIWESTDNGLVLTRISNIQWLVKQFEHQRMRLIKRRAGEFTQIYTLFRWIILRKVIHQFNRAWFKWIQIASLAHGNLLVLRKD